MKLNYATLLVIVAGAVLFMARATEFNWTPGRIAGIAIAAPSLVLLIVARIQLGSAFSVRARASKLVTTGLYARIRNPIYVFSSLMLAGVILFAGKPVWLVGLAAIAIVQMARGRRESRVLEEEFGEEYRAYRKKTWF